MSLYTYIHDARMRWPAQTHSTTKVRYIGATEHCDVYVVPIPRGENTIVRWGPGAENRAQWPGERGRVIRRFGRDEGALIDLMLKIFNPA